MPCQKSKKNVAAHLITSRFLVKSFKNCYAVSSLELKSVKGGFVLSRLKVGMTRRKGRGVFANRRIRKGEVIEVAPVIVISGRDAARIHKLNLFNHCYSWGVRGDQSALALGFGSLYNHSYDPNATYGHLFKRRAIVFRALRDIAPGEEITHNYNGSPKNQKPLWFTKNSWGYAPRIRRKK